MASEDFNNDTDEFLSDDPVKSEENILIAGNTDPAKKTASLTDKKPDIVKAEGFENVKSSTVETRRNKFSGNEKLQKKGRNKELLSQYIMTKQNQVQFCYKRFKKKDTSLKGKVKVEFVINPKGEVTDVTFNCSKWNGNPLQPKVEKSIEQVIKTWKFTPVMADIGADTIEATYIFE